MHFLLIFALLGAAEAPDGSLVYLENCNSIVETTTRDTVGHVGLVFNDQQQTWIYEAAPSQVRRVAWADYQTEIARINARKSAKNRVKMWILPPAKPYTQAECAAMRETLDQALGRRYSIAGYVKDRPVGGIHCAELASTALGASGRHVFVKQHAVTPGRLVEQLRPSSLPAVEILCSSAPEETWCARSWRRLGEMTSWCGWSCGESWSLVW